MAYSWQSEYLCSCDGVTAFAFIVSCITHHKDSSWNGWWRDHMSWKIFSTMTEVMMPVICPRYLYDRWICSREKPVTCCYWVKVTFFRGYRRRSRFFHQFWNSDSQLVCLINHRRWCFLLRAYADAPWNAALGEAKQLLNVVVAFLIRHVGMWGMCDVTVVCCDQYAVMRNYTSVTCR